MSTTLSDDTVTAAAALYIEAVRARIARLPRERRAELLDDLTHHLAELAAEPDAELADHLGDPDAFAEEYLTSAGVELPRRRSGDAVRMAFRDRVAAAADHRWSVAVLDFLPELRPAWWVARGYVPVAAALSGHGMTPFPFPDRHDDGNGERLIGTALAVGAAVVSVWLGRQAAAGRRARWNRWATLAGVVAVVVAMASLNRTGVADADEGYGVASPDSFPTPRSVYSAEGNLITNFWIFDAQGNLVQDVYVFDQNGLPVSTPVGDSGPATKIPMTPDGELVVNRYPQDELLAACPAGPGAGEHQLVPVRPPTVLIPGLELPVTPPTPSTTAALPDPTVPPSSDPLPTTPPTTIVPPQSGFTC